MTLPLILTRKNKYIVGALMYLVAYMMYYTTNHFPVFEPQYLPMSWIDRNMPFQPWTVLIYISEYFYFAFVYILLKDDDNTNQYLYSYFAAQTIACTIFFFFPVTYPREMFPIPTDLPLWLQSTWAWLRMMDAPSNCLPSLHVASCFLSAFAFITDKQKKLFWVFFSWSTAIAYTTLTTKQHYVIDIVTGVILGTSTYYWFHHRQKYLRVYPRTGSLESQV